MTDRRIIYPGQIILDTDLLHTARATAEGIGQLAMMTLGPNTLVHGMTVGATVPASLSVVVSPGSLVAPGQIDSTPYSSLGVDTHQILNHGYLRDAVALPLAPPTTAGQSRVYLIQVNMSVADTDATVLPYYNADNPDLAFSGPNNSGTPQNTTRTLKVAVGVKAGAPATTGSQVAPTVDPSWIGLAFVTVSSGATQITQANIRQNPDCPRISHYLQNLGYQISSVISATGAALDQNNPNQFYSALLSMFAPNMRVYNASGTFVVPAGVTKVKVTVVGAGGGGGGCTPSGTSFVSASGGGAGGTAIGVLNVTPGASFAVTVGQGGAGGIAGQGWGVNGGTSSFGSAMSATGGSGGTWGSATTSAGGPPGNGFGGTLNILGGFGGDGQGSETLFMPGYGGSSYMGGGGRASKLLNGQGMPGQAQGSGGGGSYGAPGTGGRGANGVVIVEW